MGKRITLLLSVLFFALIVFADQAHAQSLNKAKTGSTGHIKALVVLIEFADKDAYFTRAQVDSFFNYVGYNKYGDNGSVHDYWASVSQGRVDLETVVTEYYRAPKTFDYYDTQDGGHTSELLDSALNWLDKSGFDFSQLTVDENNNIKGLSFQYVGTSGASGLWGHSSSHVRDFDGVHTRTYQISELGTSEMHLGGICHEQGHMLWGWPDSYDIDSSNGSSNGCGKFDLMASGNSDSSGASSRNPMPPNPYFRYLAGWNDLIPLNSFPSDTTLKIVANSWNTYVYRNPDKSGEMYIIEARQKPFRNVDMPGEGVLVWHIDSVIPNNANQQHTESQHYKVSVVQADNAYHLEKGTNIGDANDYFKSGLYSTLSYSQTKWWNSSYSGLTLRNISAVADTMTAVFGGTSSSDVIIKSEKTNGGTILPYGTKFYASGSSTSFSAAPILGFMTDDCVVDGVSLGATNSYTFQNISEPHNIKFLFAHKGIDLTNPVKSVNYNYYVGNWSSMPDFSTLTPVSSGTLSTVTLAIPNRAEDYFGVRYSAYIYAPEDAEYTFYMTADDGAKLSIGGVDIVSNQVQPETTGTMILKKGYHDFILDFFEVQVSQSMTLYWSSPTVSKQRLSNFWLGTPTAVETAVNGNLNMVKIGSQLNLTGFAESTLKVQIYNLLGSVVKSDNHVIVNNQAAVVDIDDLHAGIYLVTVTDSNGQRLLSKKMIL